MAVDPTSYTAFSGQRRIASGPIEEVALAVKDWLEGGHDSVLVFDDRSGQQIDLDLRGTPEETLARLAEHPWLATQREKEERRAGPGRPKLGVTSREISLLPRHWDWLNEQPGGASATLRKLVEARMKATSGRDQARKAHDAAAKFAWVMGGNLPDFEEASRSLSRKDYARLETLIESWPGDIRDHLKTLVTRAAEADQEVGDDD
ncbi:hypothetical protein D3C87_724780 [compost metagenome]